MDSVVVANGGMKMYGNDFQFMQAGFQSALLGSLKRWTDANGGKIIVAGCNFTLISGTTYSISDGWVIISGELLYFAGSNYTFSGAVNFGLVELELYQFDMPDLDAFRDVLGSSYSPWKRRAARLKTTAGTTLALSDANRLENVMRGVLNTTVTSTSLSLSSGCALVSSSAKFVKSNGVINFMVAVSLDTLTDYSGAGGFIFATLPSGFAPAFDMSFFVPNSSRGLSMVHLKTNGDVYFEHRMSSGFIAGSTVFISISYVA